jgi:hypothetical protein
MVLAQTEILRAGRRIEAEADDAVAGPRHAAHPRIVAVQHLHAGRRRVT